MTVKTENWLCCVEQVGAEGRLGSLVRTPPAPPLPSLFACQILRAYVAPKSGVGSLQSAISRPIDPLLTE